MRNNTMEQVLIGSLLGDGSIDKYGNYTEGHCARQKDYLLWKKRIFEKKFERTSFSHYYGINRGKRSHFCNFRIPRHPIFEKYRKLCYPEEKKMVSNKFIKKIDKLAIVVWYFDDGNYNTYSNTIQISSDGFSYEEQKKLQRMLKNRFNLNFKIQRHLGKAKFLYNLRCRGIDTDKFLAFVKKNAPFVPKSMIYKLGKFHKGNLKWIAESIKIYKKHKKDYYQKDKKRISQERKKYYLKNRKKIIKLHKEYKKKNKIRYQVLDRKYRKKNKKKIQKYRKEYRRKNKEKLREKDKKYYLESKRRPKKR